MNNTIQTGPHGRNRTNARLTGIFFIAATTFAIAGLKLYDPVLAAKPDFVRMAENHNHVVLGALFELVLVASAIGTGIMLFPYLRLYNERLGLGYVVFRFLEAILITIGVVSVLALLTIGKIYAEGSAIDPDRFQTEAALLKAIHDWTFILGPHFILGINTFIYSYVFLKTTLVPRKLAIMGLFGALLIFIAANLELFGVIQVNDTILLLMALPIALYEMILATWLLTMGFNLTKLKDA